MTYLRFDLMLDIFTFCDIGELSIATACLILGACLLKWNWMILNFAMFF